jgi:tRNA (guanine10-N2)-methyltransferase
MTSFLIFFVHRHFEFRYAEVEALLTMLNLTMDDCLPKTLPDPSISPVLRIQLPSEKHAKFLSARGILVKGVYEVWGQCDGANYQELLKKVSIFEGESKQRALNDECCSWRINVEGFGKKLSMQEQHAKRELFSDVLPFPGPVSMQNPTETFLILEEIGVDTVDHDMTPKRLFFLRELAGSEKNRGRGGARDLIDQQTLKKRAYIGPTSMESEMALLMCNMALIQQNDLVMDPFVGTGSVLIPCATHGAFCYGTDIDIRVLLGTGVGVSGPKKGKGTNNSTPAIDEQYTIGRTNVMTNFKQYGLPIPELIRADNSISPLIEKCAEYFDAIVCDPPYGIRAGARRSGRCPSKNHPIDLKKADQTYIPPTQPYAAEDVMNDLLTFAAKTLRVGGRLVYLLPTTYEYTDADLPCHPLLQVIANSEQKLTQKYARRLITMIKVKEILNPNNRQIKDNPNVSFANLRQKILEQNRKRKIEQTKLLDPDSIN